MVTKQKKRSILARVRNYFIAGIVVLIPIGVTIYLTLLLASISSKILPKEINPNHYLPYNIPGVEIVMAIILIAFFQLLELYYRKQSLSHNYSSQLPQEIFFYLCY